MISRTIYFHECEHEGDLRNYQGDLRASGASILSSHCDSEQETGQIRIQVEDEKYAAFLEKFKQTDSYGFSSLCR